MSIKNEKELSIKNDALIRDEIPCLPIIEKDGNIFCDEKIRYQIPLYQRAFAWEEGEIIQLIEDINQADKDKNYYIGSLIVDRKADYYEVIDGQQRLTALFLLLNVLGIRTLNTLTFELRDKSNYTLKNIGELERVKRENENMLEDSIASGYRIISEQMCEGFKREEFIERLKRVVIYRIEVPKDTDLNRYFEIMNTRGEQLEQHDILKSKLACCLGGDNDSYEKRLFARIWEACSDMSCYVQMRLSLSEDSLNKENLRTRFFGNDWQFLQEISLKNLNKISYKKDKRALKETPPTIENIIAPTFFAEEEGVNEREERVRFESIITFPYLLLHTLWVFIEKMGIIYEEDKGLSERTLDDKKLLKEFKGVLENGVIKGKEGMDRAEFQKFFAGEFICFLLKCRYLFDKYIIKREYSNDSVEGKWSLKKLYAQAGKGCYANTDFKRKGEHNTTEAQKNKQDKRKNSYLMLQAALRVSYTSPKAMRWITILLAWLSNEDNLKQLDSFGEEMKNIARKAVREGFIEPAEGMYNFGVRTPHVVFNYLDYLLWEAGSDKYSDFDFEFRNSVEHWYPQHPLGGTIETWTTEEGLDSFGNLCIVQRHENSKFSNLSPTSKKDTYKDIVTKSSLKLRIMAELTGEGYEANVKWKEENYKLHETEMIEILTNDLSALG